MTPSDTDATTGRVSEITEALIRVGPLYFLTADFERARYRFVRITRKRPSSVAL